MLKCSFYEQLEVRYPLFIPWIPLHNAHKTNINFYRINLKIWAECIETWKCLSVLKDWSIRSPALKELMEDNWQTLLLRWFFFFPPQSYFAVNRVCLWISLFPCHLSLSWEPIIADIREAPNLKKTREMCQVWNWFTWQFTGKTIPRD